MKNFAIIACFLLSAAGCYRELPILAVKLEDSKFEYGRRCQYEWKTIKGNPVKVKTCQLVKVPVNKADFNPITEKHIQSWIDTANLAWFPRSYNFSFDQKADFITIRSTLLNTPPCEVCTDPSCDSNNCKIEWDAYEKYGRSLALLLVPAKNKVVVFFRGRGGVGWSGGPPGNFVSMPAFTHTGINKPSPGSPNHTLLSHELGHYFGLAHTFNEGDCSKVNLTNTDGDIKGGNDQDLNDDIHDTNPDPGGCAPTYSLNCPGGTVIINGVTYDPPWRNIMSYHDRMPEEMTDDQKKAIEYSFKHSERINLGKLKFIWSKFFP